MDVSATPQFSDHRQNLSGLQPGEKKIHNENVWESSLFWLVGYVHRHVFFSHNQTANCKFSVTRKNRHGKRFYIYCSIPCMFWSNCKLHSLLTDYKKWFFRGWVLRKNAPLKNCLPKPEERNTSLRYFRDCFWCGNFVFDVVTLTTVKRLCHRHVPIQYRYAA